MRAKKVATLFFIMYFALGFAKAQRSAAVTNKKKEPSIAAIPLINYNSTQGAIVGAIVSKYYKINKNDSISPSSNSGIIGIYTAQKSYALFGYSRLYFDKDRWRIVAAAGTLDIAFQFFLEDPGSAAGNFYDYSTQANLIVLQVQRHIFKRIYIGPTGSFVKATTTYGLPAASGGDSITKSNLNNIGFIITNDSRDHIQFPTHGIFLNFKNQFYRDWVGSDYKFERYIATYNQFFKLTKQNDRQILAVRATFNIAAGDVPFEGQTVVGSDDIRGYSQGKYRNNQVYTLQSEYRWNFYGRWGMVAFAGVASAVETFSDIFKSELLPGAGAGIRFRMLPSQRVNIGIDGGVGKGDYSITFRIGEAFGR